MSRPEKAMRLNHARTAPGGGPPAPCPLCSGSQSRSFPIYYEFNSKTFSGRECRTCGFLYLSPRPDADDLQKMYGEEYFTGSDAEHGAHSSTDYETAAIRGSVKFPEILGWIQKYHRRGRFFEIGCGMGYFLDFARQNGFEVGGIEYSEFGARAAREKFNLDVVQGSLDTLDLPEASFEVVFMGDVLEHMVDPLLELRRVSRLLRPGGIVAIEVPSQFNAIVGRAAVMAYRATGKKRFMRLPPYHVNEFRPATIRRMLEAAGYIKVRVVQRVKPPSTITLRGSAFDRMAKLSLQYPNYWITRSLRVLGDRILAIAVKS